jgi:hypothetical protein
VTAPVDTRFGARAARRSLVASVIAFLPIHACGSEPGTPPVQTAPSGFIAPAAPAATGAYAAGGGTEPPSGSHYGGPSFPSPSPGFPSPEPALPDPGPVESPGPAEPGPALSPEPAPGSGVEL